MKARLELGRLISVLIVLIEIARCSYAIPLDDGTWDERELVTVLGGHVPGVLHFICLPCWSRGSRHQCRRININGIVDNAVK